STAAGLAIATNSLENNYGLRGHLNPERPTVTGSLICPLHFPNHQRAIFRSKSDAVAEGDAHVCFARFEGNVIQLASRIGLVKINSWRNDASAHGAQRGAQARRTACALRMSHLGFRRRHRNAM